MERGAGRAELVELLRSRTGVLMRGRDLKRASAYFARENVPRSDEPSSSTGAPI